LSGCWAVEREPARLCSSQARIQDDRVCMTNCGDAPNGRGRYGGEMADHLFEEPRLAELYDLFSPSAARDDFGFYLPLLMSASSVLDVGC
jgi:hypothetical protein